MDLFALVIAACGLLHGYFGPEIEARIARDIKKESDQEAVLAEYAIVSSKWWYRYGMTYESIKAELGL